MTNTLNWQRILTLNSVRSMSALLDRRGSSHLCFFEPDGTPALGQTADPLAPPNWQDADRSQPLAPIVVDGACQGWVAASDPAAFGESPILSDLVHTVADEIERFSGTKQEAPTSTFGMVGISEAMTKLFDLISRVRHADSTVLIEGENGTGKELVARAIHNASPRGDKPFIAQNCAALNDNLLESELFGHVRGAFTDAYQDKPGLFERAHNGTLFLDEIGDTTPALQVKLLRVLQEGVLQRVGDTRDRKVDVRIIAATNRDLSQLVESGELREDLYYRLRVISVRTPSLRERIEDLEPLVQHFITKYGQPGQPKQLTDRCLEQMRNYPWPGNVRELENEIERLVVLSGTDSAIDVDALSEHIRAKQPAAATSTSNGSSLPDALADLEQRMILEVLRRNQWNKSRAARELQVSRRNLIRKVQKYRLDDLRNQ